MSNPKDCEHGVECCAACQRVRIMEIKYRPRIRGCSHSPHCCEACRRARVRAGMYKAQEKGKSLGRPHKDISEIPYRVAGWGWA